MNTFLLIAGIVCVVEAAANIYFSAQARKIARNYADKLYDVELQEQGIQKRNNALDSREKQIRSLERLFAGKIHVGYTVTLSDPDGKLPEYPDRSALKALKSGIGYKTVPAMKKHIKCVREGGKTRYSLDLYVLPYDE